MPTANETDRIWTTAHLPRPASNLSLACDTVDLIDVGRRIVANSQVEPVDGCPD